MLVRLYTHSGDSTNLWKRKAFIKWLIGRNKFGFRIRFLRQNFGKKAIVASAAIYLFDILISNVFQAPVDRSRVTVSFFLYCISKLVPSAIEPEAIALPIENGFFL